MKTLASDRRVGTAHLSDGIRDRAVGSAHPTQRRACVWLIAFATLAGCTGEPAVVLRVNPFENQRVISFDDDPQPVESSITPLGELRAGDVIRLRVDGEAVEEFLILTQDSTFDQAGVIVGGGRPGRTLDYRVPDADAYFVYIQLAATATGSATRATLTFTRGADVSPPTEQRVLVSFADDYLSNPGLFDPESGTAEQQAFLESISDLVRDDILARLRTVFEDTPIRIVDERDGLPQAPFSQVTFSPDRAIAEADDLAVDAVSPPGAGRPECAGALVLFGEVLPRGTGLDPGNQVLDDEAVVYVGSFQGRGETCQSAAINSVNNIVLGLAQTAAHEIGHLVGLHHTALEDVMSRSPSMAFQRQLDFTRGQILVETLGINADGSTSLATTVLTTVIQEPDTYFSAIFAR